MPTKDPERRRRNHAAYLRKRYAEDKEYRDTHKAYVKVNSAKQRATAREIVAEFRADGCTLCDEKEPCCLDAHHVDPHGKDMNIARAIAQRWSAKRIKAELAKCICVCANCHRKIHQLWSAFDDMLAALTN